MYDPATHQRLTELLDGGEPVDVIYLDFRNSLDTVPHWILIKKFQAYGMK